MRQQTKGNQTADIEPNKSFQITADDNADISIVGAKIHCNSTGNYNIQLEGDDTSLIFFLVAGVTYPFRVKRVFLTNTDNATGLIGLTSIWVKDKK